MDRLASKIVAAAAITLLLAVFPAPGETGKEQSPAKGAAKDTGKAAGKAFNDIGKGLKKAFR